jgi:cytidylate kinase
MPRSKPVVAIDGPAGSGKTTVARLVAGMLGYSLVDTGALYRCVALAARRRDVDAGDGERLGRLAGGIRVEFKESPGGQAVLLDGEDVTVVIREPEVSQDASRVSAHPQVRRALLDMQRELGRDGGVVLEGRDIGTVVFPDAEVKVFLTATVDVRARRRFDELSDKQIEVTLDKTRDDMISRDERDESRDHAPMKPAQDAEIVATENLSAQQVADLVVERVRTFLRGVEPSP